MSKATKKAIGALLFIWVAGVIGYFVMYDDAPTAGRMFFVVAASVPAILAIRVVVMADKNERLEESKELRMYRLIHATIDGVVEIQKQQGGCTYKVYTDTDVYMVECGKTISKIIHTGTYQRVDMEG